MYSIIVGVIIFVSFLLVLIILAQNPKGGGLTSTFGGGDSNQLMGVQKTNDLLEKLTWILACTMVFLTLTTNLFVEKEGIDEVISPNIDKANEQDIMQNIDGDNQELEELNLDSIN